MAKEFKQLLGSRVYIEVPEKEESKVVLDENTKQALEKAFLEKLNRLKVYAVGKGITPDYGITEGCEVLIEPTAIRDAKLIPISDDKKVMLVGLVDIIHVW